jgi:cytochrome c-type biogenesis protein CcmH
MILLLAFALAAGPDPSSIVGPPVGEPVSGEALRTATYRVAKTIRCPVCQGMSAADSPSESARAMKDEVQALVAQGYDDEQVVAYFEASYGEFIRLDPRAEGWNLAVWAAPGVALLLGLAVVGRVASRWRAGAPALEPVPEGLEPYVKRVWADVGTAEAPRG